MIDNGLLSLFHKKENVLENVLQKTPFGFSLINIDYVFEFANEAWLKIVQKTTEEVLGKKIFDIFPETEEYLLSIFENVKNTREPFYAPEHSIKLKRKGLIEDVFSISFISQFMAKMEICNISQPLFWKLQIL